MITLTKNLNDNENRFRRINVKKITSLKKLLNTPINKVKFNLKNMIDLEELSKQLKNKNGITDIELKIEDSDKKFIFKLKNKRKLDRKTINLIKNKDISSLIN